MTRLNDSAEHHDGDQSPRGRSLRWPIVGMVTLLLVYSMSMPFVMGILITLDVDPEKARLEDVYAPVFWVCEKFPDLAPFYDWYFRWVLQSFFVDYWMRHPRP